ncbi:hypothetical protein AN189_17695 [Loktanella sp. 3ANDIMAR09]|nr:hypothetical protein AN189_17695 [Loktanella sp. 3ANDIMAR09]
MRRGLTRVSGLFFNEASWMRHDEGYHAGHPSRVECDRKFLQAMLRDASETTTTARVFACCVLAWVFWAAVRIGGWASYGRSK